MISRKLEREMPLHRCSSASPREMVSDGAYNPIRHFPNSYRLILQPAGVHFSFVALTKAYASKNFEMDRYCIARPDCGYNAYDHFPPALNI